MTEYICCCITNDLIGKPDSECDKVRAEAMDKIKAKYPNATIHVSASDSYHQVRGFDTPENDNADEEVAEELDSIIAELLEGK